MKILKEGKIPEPAGPWWAGEVITCDNCKAEFELEPGDKVSVTPVKPPLHQSVLTVPCPSCSNAITLLYRVKQKGERFDIELLKKV